MFSPIKEELYAYIGGICKKMECDPICIGGYSDHVHVLCLLSRKVALMKLVEEIKSHSSRWMKMKSGELQGFYWQEGYGAFSVSPFHVQMLKGYIKNQEEHHQQNSFQDEYRTILEKYEVDYDERYVWD